MTAFRGILSVEWPATDPWRSATRRGALPLEEPVPCLPQGARLRRSPSRCWSSASVAYGIPFSPPPPLSAGEPKDAKVKELLKERLAILTQLAQATEQDYLTGKTSFDRVQ